ncbi:MAG: hypothetical protein GY903_19710 [Fuerstiella sp.]|nr:hypothetical protein [Fuerstiella sp.]MCP4856714.1 hypothetical protein [Fuerstiella sp.]
MRSPSDNLLQLISELQLCDQQDVAACEATVRLLCRDLPDFDSVWIDALAQRRVLTPWQADVLQSPDPHQLRVGPYVLTEQLGNNTFLGRKIDSHDTVVVYRLPDANSESAAYSDRAPGTLIQRAEQLRGTSPVAIALPFALTETEASAPPSVVSEFVPGWNADELLIRGGRLPWPVVAEIGQQLLTVLTCLESHDLYHGEIVLRNVRLRPDGKAVLVAPFVARQQNPFTSFTESLTLREIETIAPELVATGNSPDSRTEIYAVGCVLWQLLTSRPVFPSADPVTRLVQAKANDVDDVRDLVPDCPDWLARAIHNFTRRSPELRPQSFPEASDHWSSHAGVGCPATRRLCHRLPDRRLISQSKTSAERPSSRVRVIGTVVASAAMICGFVSYGIYRGLLPLTLIMNHGDTSANSELQGATSAASPAASLADVSQPDANGVYAMPKPDAAGVVVLQSGQTYRAADLLFTGVMHIEASGDRPASVVITPASPWRVEASQVLLNNVRLFIHDAQPPAVNVNTAILCTCDVLSMTDCVIDTSAADAATSCVHWSAASGVTNVISMRNCVFSGGSYGMWLSAVPDRCTLTNTLFINRKAALRCDVSTAGNVSPRLTLSQVTQAVGDSFLDIVAETQAVKSVAVQFLCGESVLAPSEALLRIALPAGADSQAIKTEFLLPERGHPTVVPPTVDPVVYFDRSLNQMVRLAESQIVAESLLIAEPIFRNATGDLTGFQQFELLDFEGPKLSQQMPGIDASALPTETDRMSRPTQAD